MSAMDAFDGYKEQLRAAEAKDAEFALGKDIRDKFPRGDVVAAAGHSLSRPCGAALSEVTQMFERVKEELHGVHSDRNSQELADSDFAFKLHLHEPSCAVLSELLGCDKEDVNLGNGLSDDLIRLLDTLVHPEVFGKRCKVMCLKRDFNSDMTIVRTFMLKCVINALLAVSSLVQQGVVGKEFAGIHQTLSAVFLNSSVPESEQFAYIEKRFLVVIPPMENGLYDQNTIVSLIQDHKDELAGALVPAVVFNTGQLFDIKKVNKEFVDAGIPAVWDMAHSIGNVVHSVSADKVLAAAGCGYKHLNGLPGGPGMIFLNSSQLDAMERAHSHVVSTPTSGWLSHGRTGPFDAFPTIDRFSVDTLHPRNTIQRLRAGNPEVLGLKVLMANLAVTRSFGVDKIMALKEALTVCLIGALDTAFKEEQASGSFRLITPRAAGLRGATMCFTLAEVDATQMEKALVEDKFQLGHKFEVDVRPGGDDPDTFRITAHYCHMGFADAVNLAFCLKAVYDQMRTKSQL
jgi:kynureninase